MISVLSRMFSVFKEEDFWIKEDDICINEDEFCIKEDDFWIREDDFCIKEDDFCINEDESVQRRTISVLCSEDDCVQKAERFDEDERIV